MVKGISRQVIVVHGPGEGMFDQAIFILKDSAVEKGITDDALMKEAKAVLRSGNENGGLLRYSGPAWACGGAAVTGLVWLLTALL